MACGLPAVVSDLVGCREDLIEEGKTGLSYPCGDPEALAACLAQMAGDPEASQRMGQAGRERVEKAFTVEAAAAGIRAGVMRVIGRSPATGDR
jgi:glycosyltransferase involved in cell wall biosynthesis